MLTVGKKMSYASFYKQTYLGTLVTFTLCIVTSEILEIAETVDAGTKTGLLILAEIKREELTTRT